MRKVYVYNYHVQSTKGHENRPLAYFTWQGGDPCMHIVEPDTSARMKSEAIKQHKERCSDLDPACHSCR